MKKKNDKKKILIPQRKKINKILLPKRLDLALKVNKIFRQMRVERKISIGPYF